MINVFTLIIHSVQSLAYILRHLLAGVFDCIGIHPLKSRVFSLCHSCSLTCCHGLKVVTIAWH